MTVSTGDVLRVVLSMLFGDGGVVQNVFSFVLTGGGGPWDVIDILSDLSDYFDGVYDAITTEIDDDLDGSELIAYVWDSVDEDFDEIGSEPWSWSPSSNGSSMPRGVAALTVAPTTDPDTLGKKYVPGWTEESFNGGTLTAGAIAAMVGFAEDWILPVVGSASGATLTPGVWSVKNEAHVSFRDAYTVHAIAAYQRRRKRGVGI